MSFPELRNRHDVLQDFRSSNKALRITDGDSDVLSRALSAVVEDGNGLLKEVVVIDAKKLYEGDAEQIAYLQGLIGGGGNSVLYSAQTPTVAQAAIARNNLSLVPASGLVIHVSKATTATDTRTGLNVYDPAKPFATCAAAKTAATSGDTIIVWPGTYTDVNLLKNGVNWYFMPGALVIPSSGASAIFDDTSTGANGAVTSIIGGYGSFTHSITGSGLAHVIKISNASTNLTFEANYVRGDSGTLMLHGGASRSRISHTYSTGGGVPAVKSLGGIHTIVGDKIEANDYDAVWGAGGELNIVANHIVGGNNGVETSGAGKVYVTANLIESDGTGVGDTAINLGGDAGSEIHVRASVVRNNSSSAAYVISCDGSESGEIAAERVFGGGAQDFPAVIEVSAGTVRFQGCYVKANGATVAAAFVQAGTPVFQNCVLVAGASADSFLDPLAPVTVQALDCWSNKAPNANVTIVGSLNVNAAVV